MVMASSRPSTTSYSVTWSSRTLQPSTPTKPTAGNVGSGTSPWPPSIVRPRSTTANWPSASEPLTGDGSGTCQRTRWSRDRLSNAMRDAHERLVRPQLAAVVLTSVGTVSSVRPARSAVRPRGHSKRRTTTSAPRSGPRPSVRISTDSGRSTSRSSARRAVVVAVAGIAAVDDAADAFEGRTAAAQPERAVVRDDHVDEPVREAPVCDLDRVGDRLRFDRAAVDLARPRVAEAPGAGTRATTRRRSAAWTTSCQVSSGRVAAAVATPPISSSTSSSGGSATRRRDDDPRGIGRGVGLARRSSGARTARGHGAGARKNSATSDRGSRTHRGPDRPGRSPASGPHGRPSARRPMTSRRDGDVELDEVVRGRPARG